MSTGNPPHPPQRRPLPLLPIFLLILIGLVIVAVMAVLYMPLPKHFPPEDPEITAKRLSPENGFYALEEAATQIKIIRDSLWSDWEVWEPYVDFPWTPGLPEDPEMRAELETYFDKAAPALAKMRQGLEAEYYLLPEIGDLMMDSDYLGPWREIARILIAQARWHESQGRYQEAMNCYLDIARLGMVGGSDGTVINAMSTGSITSIGTGALNSSLHEYDDPELLRNAIEALQDIYEREAPFSQIFGFQFRILDNTAWLNAQYSASGLSFEYPITDAPDGLPERIELILFKMSSGEYWDRFLQVVDKPLLEFEQARPSPPGDPISQNFFPTYEKIVTLFAQKRAHLRGSILSLTLRLYRVEHGAYPISLDALVPDYVDALPIDPFSGKPFIYSKAGDDFRLYSLGDDKDDDGGILLTSIDGEVTGDLIIHLPLEEWLALEAEEPRGE